MRVLILPRAAGRIRKVDHLHKAVPVKLRCIAKSGDLGFRVLRFRV